MSQNSETPNQSTSPNMQQALLEMPDHLEMYDITLDKMWELYEGRRENQLKSVLLEMFTKKLSEHETVKTVIDAEEMIVEEHEPMEEPEDREAVERKIARERLQAQNPGPKIMVHPEPQSGKRPPTDEVSPLVMAPEYVHRRRVNSSALRQIMIETEMENRRRAEEMIFPYKSIELFRFY